VSDTQVGSSHQRGLVAHVCDACARGREQLIHSASGVPLSCLRITPSTAAVDGGVLEAHRYSSNCSHRLSRANNGSGSDTANRTTYQQ